MNDIKINPRGGILSCAQAGSYLFAEIAERKRNHTPQKGRQLIDLGIGDVTLPLTEPVTRALATAAAEMGTAAGFRGYPPAEGYGFLREAVAARYARLGAAVDADEIFISDGAKTDLALIPQLFGECTVYLTDPTYPAYRDVNISLGNRIKYLAANEENGFLPMPDAQHGTGIYYICSPSNPTGAAYTRDCLAAWVAHTRATGSLMICDSAYSDFIGDGDNCHPRTVYEIPGARECAVEVNSFSKSAGFTGLRCGFTVIPSEMTVGGVPLARLWRRYRSITSNGVAYPVQRAAAAALTAEGRRACRKAIDYYLENAALLRRALGAAGITVAAGGISPYVWFRCPDGLSSWDFFDRLLDRADIIGTPGSGFGAAGEGYFRFSAFCRHEDAAEAAERIHKNT